MVDEVVEEQPQVGCLLHMVVHHLVPLADGGLVDTEQLLGVLILLVAVAVVAAHRSMAEMGRIMVELVVVEMVHLFLLHLEGPALQELLILEVVVVETTHRTQAVAVVLELLQ
jgi:hypothetical protein